MHWLISTQVKTSRAAPVVVDDDELGVFETATGAEAGAWLARVVAGAADGPTAFDPFSSRKAHVLKQAKQFLAVHKSDCRDASRERT